MSHVARLVVLSVMFIVVWELVSDWRIFLALYILFWAHNIEKHWGERDPPSS